MDGIKTILDGVKKILDELFGGFKEHDGFLRAIAGPLGVTGVYALVDVALEPGVNERAPYPVLHFVVTLAKDIQEENSEKIRLSLEDLNLAIAAGPHPSFGSFCYSPSLGQIFLSYLLPINPDVAEGELSNIMYYFGALYEELDLYADFIMLLCEEGGTMPGLPDYLDYLDDIIDFDDYEARAELLDKRISSVQEKISSASQNNHSAS